MLRLIPVDILLITIHLWFTCTVVVQIDVVSRVVESAALDNLTLVEITAAALTVTGALETPTNS